jgi:hypothetical protein
MAAQRAADTDCIRMKTLLPIAALMLSGAEATKAAELPTYARAGFSSTTHQLQVLGPYGVPADTVMPQRQRRGVSGQHLLLERFLK